MKLLELDPAVIELLREPGRSSGGKTASVGEETTGAGAGASGMRGRMVAATRLPLPGQREVIEAYHSHVTTTVTATRNGGKDHSRGNPVRIEPKILELISAALFHEGLRPLWDSQSQSDAQQERDQEEVLATSQQFTIATAADGEQHGGVDYAHLVSLALELPTHRASGEWLARCYLGLANPISSTATGANTNNIISSSTASIGSVDEPIYKEEEATEEAVEQGRTGVGVQGSSSGSFSSNNNNNPNRHKGSSGSPAEGRGGGRSGQSGSSSRRGHSADYGNNAAAEYCDEVDSYGSGSDSADLDDNDDTAGFEFTFAGAAGSSAGEIPPGLAEQLEAQGYSETAQKALATLAPKDREVLLEIVSAYPQVKGKVRRIISLMNREGWSLTASLDEIMVGWHGGLPPASTSVSALASELADEGSAGGVDRREQGNGKGGYGLIAELEELDLQSVTLKTLSRLNPAYQEALTQLLLERPEIERQVGQIAYLLSKGRSLPEALNEVASLEMGNIEDSRSASAQEIILTALSKIVDATTNFTVGLDMLKQGAIKASSGLLSSSYSSSLSSSDADANEEVLPAHQLAVVEGEVALQTNPDAPIQTLTLKQLLPEPYQGQMREILAYLILAIQQTDLSLAGGFEI